MTLGLHAGASDETLRPMDLGKPLPTRSSHVATKSALAQIVAALFTLGLAATADARPYRLTPADRTEITQLLQTFFDATRDGNTAAARATMPTLPELQSLFQSGFAPFVEMHQQALDRAIRELRPRFAGGTFVGLAGSFVTSPNIEIRACGRWSSATSECAAGPVIEWRAGTETRRLRIDTLVRMAGRWRIFDPRL